ncbi:hypothetical protein HII31_02334 [Pseudocercospora fuligena]|uniref:Uncharacterized protein n=1 Tax=Pseudocercospora fuligena TaxID=685502 RepID=A0A8H6RSX3_9PEZI|nr:hypothetical protein HII31_02334 [Pseudocercospora fuligena]
MSGIRSSHTPRKSARNVALETQSTSSRNSGLPRPEWLCSTCAVKYVAQAPTFVDLLTNYSVKMCGRHLKGSVRRA